MGCGASTSTVSAETSGGHNIDEAYDYNKGPLSKREIKSRIETVGPKYFQASGHLKLKYAAVSQRGYYPESLNKANQDAFKIDPNSFGEGKFFVGVFDGHGPKGDGVSGFTRDHIVSNFKKCIKAGKGDLNDQIAQALQLTNNGVKSMDDRHSGTTSVTAFLQGTQLQIANIGDSRAVLATMEDGKLTPKALSNDQTPYRKDERIRVRKSGARVCTMDQLDGLAPMNDDYDVALGEEIDEGGDPPRVWHPTRRLPGCAFTRSIGDSVAEALGVFAEPEVVNREICPADQFLVLASDGVWEFITSQSVIEMVAEYDECLEACRHVVAEAYRQWLIYDDRTDDITMCVIEFHFDGEHSITSTSTTTTLAASASGASLASGDGGDHHHISEMRPVRRGMSKDKRKRMQAVKKISDEVREQVQNFDVSKHVQNRTPQEEARILATLQGNFLFEHLNPSQKKILVGLFTHRKVAKGEVVIKQGDEGDYFYVVDTGHYQVFVESAGPEPVFEYQPPSCFGELALMHGKPRAATVTAAEEGSLWCLSFLAFHAICSRTPHRELLAALRNVKVLNTLSTSQLQRMADITSEVKFGEGKLILEEGSSSDSFYIIKSGAVVCYDKAVADADADADAGAAAEQEKADSGKGKGKEVMRLGPLDYLNEKALLNRSTVEHTFVAGSATVLLEISRRRFEEVLGQLDTVITANSNRRKAWNKIQRLRVAENVSGLDNFVNVGKLWDTETGHFSLLRSKEDSSHTFVLRTNSKYQVKARNEEKELMREKEIMLHLPNHSMFFPELLKTFMDDVAVYSLHFVTSATDLSSLQDLEGIQTETGGQQCGEQGAMFYGACLALAIKQLQSIFVLSRQIVPDKILVDSNGYPRLFDFRNAKRLDSESELTYTMCGSPDYMAPEQVNQQGHGLAVDCWALGCLLFEVVTGGSTPFRSEDSSTETSVYAKITNHTLGELSCPDSFSTELADLLNKLLNPNAEQRLEFSKTWQNHPWWNRVNFEDIRRGVKAAPHRAQCAAKVQELLTTERKNTSASSKFPNDPAPGGGGGDGDGDGGADFSCFDGYTLMDRYFTTGGMATAPASFSGVVWRKSFVKKKNKA